MATHNQRVFKFDLRAKKITEVGKGAIGVIMLTTKPYAVEDQYVIQAHTPGNLTASLKILLHKAAAGDSYVASSPTIYSAYTRLVTSNYQVPLEAITAAGPVVSSALLYSTLKKYTATSTVFAGGPAVISGVITRVLVYYTNWPRENATAASPAIASARIN